MEENRKPHMVLTIFCLVAVIVVGIVYNGYMSKKIYEESANHLEEIYSQVNTSFRSLVSRNWNMLDAWGDFLAGTADASGGELSAFVKKRQDSWNFTDFYFISENGEYRTIEGAGGALNFEEELERLTRDRENIVVEETGQNGGDVMIFAVPVTAGSYQGFDYSAIAIGYNNEDMEQALEVEAFSGQSECYVVYPDGRVLVSAGKEGCELSNYADYLKEQTDFSKQSLDALAADWEGGNSGVAMYRDSGTGYYLAYQPIGYMDWILLGVVPEEVVNAGMEDMHWGTAIEFAVIFLLLGLVLASNLLWKSRKHMGEKDLEIKYREQLFGKLSDSVDDIFLLLGNDDLDVEYVSPNIERLLGITPDQVKECVGIIRESMTDPGEPLSKQELNAIPMDGHIQLEMEHIHQTNGKRHWYRETIYHVQIQNTEKFIIVLSDRTVENKMTEGLRQALDVAQGASRAKNHFLSNMSHDIRTPMNAIVGFSMLLGKNAKDEDKVKEYARKIGMASQYLINLINDVLDMSKIESGRTTLNIAEFSLPGMIEELDSILAPQVNAKEQHFEIQVHGKVPETLLGDRLRVNQILLNLLSNAVKYSPPGGQIRLVIQKVKPSTERCVYLRFEVIDHGIGIRAEDLPHIFEPFAPAPQADGADKQRTGLGMAITKNLVELMGGSISAQSQQGEGSTFTVDLEFELPQKDAVEDFWSAQGISRLFVLDADEDICRGIREWMEGTGVKVDYATDAEQALHRIGDAHAAGNGYQAIILDWKLKGADGLEAVRQIRDEIGNDVPVISLSAYDWSEVEMEAREAGINAFMPKPFFVSSLRKAIERIRKGNGQEKEEDAPQNEGLDELSLEGRSFLVAEDNELNAEILFEILKMSGARCELAVNGQRAVKKFQRSKPGRYDMILMDIQMPVMDGYEATRQIRACGHPEAATIPIVAMTANAFAEDVQAALNAGMNAHVSKPVDILVMANTLRGLLGQEERAPDVTS